MLKLHPQCIINQLNQPESLTMVIIIAVINIFCHSINIAAAAATVVISTISLSLALSAVRYSDKAKPPQRQLFEHWLRQRGRSSRLLNTTGLVRICCSLD